MKSPASISFAKARRDHSQETAEDYIEAVSDIVHLHGECRVKHLAAHMGVSHVTVTRIVARLQQENLLNTKPYYPIRLTAKGERLAAKIRHRHQIVVQFLHLLGVQEDTASRDAEGIEHHVSDETLACMQEFIDQQTNKQQPEVTS